PTSANQMGTSVDPSLTVAQYLHGTATLPTSYTVAGTDGTLTVFADGSYSYSVTSHAAATDVFTLTTLDQNGFVTSTTLTFGVPVVNHAPTITVTDPAAVTEGNTGTPAPMTVTIADQVAISDVDSNDVQTKYVAGTLAFDAAHSSGHGVSASQFT